MYNLYIIAETYVNGYYTQILNMLTISSIIFGIFIIISKNPIVSVLFLIFLFCNVSVYLVMLGLNFIGISYVLVYVGAVSILFLFILMLINIRISELLSDTGNSAPLAIFIALSFYYPIIKIMGVNKDNSSFIFSDISDYYHKIMYASSNNWDGVIAEITDITSLGNVMYSSYSIWLIISSLILLLAMVGSIVITIR